MPLRRMAEQDWIASYRHREGLSQAPNGIGRRLRRPLLLGEALHTLDEGRWHECERGFLRFYPALICFSERQLAHYRAGQGEAGSGQ